jgi:hypothetical protein
MAFYCHWWLILWEAYLFGWPNGFQACLGHIFNPSPHFTRTAQIIEPKPYKKETDVLY